MKSRRRFGNDVPVVTQNIVINTQSVPQVQSLPPTATTQAPTVQVNLNVQSNNDPMNWNLRPINNVPQDKPLPPLKLHQFKSMELWSIIGALGFSGFILLVNSSSQSSNGGLSGIVPLILMIVLGYSLVVDIAGVGTLRGAMRWAPMSSQRKLAMGCSWFFLYPFYLFYYFGRITYDWYTARSLEPEQRRHTTAHLESKLGMMPIVEGECEHCHHPLTLDATFCTYCGKETHPKAKVCSSCATLAPPDARYCPKCRTALM